MTTVDELMTLVRKFRDERDWTQFHTPKNLVIALTAELGELAELMEWRTDEEVLERARIRREMFEDELGDVAITLLLLADSLGIDLGEAVKKKMKKNEEKYPVETSKGHKWKNHEKWR